MDSGRPLGFSLGLVTCETLLDNTSCSLPGTVETDISSV